MGHVRARFDVPNTTFNASAMSGTISSGAGPQDQLVSFPPMERESPPRLIPIITLSSIVLGQPSAGALNDVTAKIPRELDRVAWSCSINRKK
jgi:hypothetical protein